MLNSIFSQPKKKKYVTIPHTKAEKEIPDGLMMRCDACQSSFFTTECEQNMMVCPKCGFHFPIGAWQRIKWLVDAHSFEERAEQLTTVNPLSFPGYEEKIRQDMGKTGLKEAVVMGTAKIEDLPCVVAIMDRNFRMGSMGSVVGEKITQGAELAKELKVPYIVFTASGGARMQEGMISLMQMAKTAAAFEALHEAGILSMIVMTNPTTGGVSASFATLGDILIAEPGALIGFAGRRVIEQTVREELPENFQTSEFLMEHGQLDAIVARTSLPRYLGKMLRFHHQGGAEHV